MKCENENRAPKLVSKEMKCENENRAPKLVSKEMKCENENRAPKLVSKEMKCENENRAPKSELFTIFGWIETLAVRVALRATSAATRNFRFKIISERPLIQELFHRATTTDCAKSCFT
jgi:hypothetical protein